MTRVSRADRTSEVLIFEYRSRKKCIWTAFIFVTDCYYLCGVNFSCRIKCSRKNVSHKKRCGLLGFNVFNSVID